MLLESQISSQPLAKRFFHQSFLSRDAYDRALGRDVINGRSKLTSQHGSMVTATICPRPGMGIASSTVGGSLAS